MRQYETKEQCLAANGEHCWHEVKPTNSATVPKSDFQVVLVLPVFETDNDPREVCYHRPARRVYRQVQEPKFEWVEE